MFDVHELYQQLVIDHGRYPRNFGPLESYTHVKEGFNPLCGDQIKVYLKVEDNVIQAASFEGHGCAISTASASLLTEAVKGMSFSGFDALFQVFHSIVTEGKSTGSDIDQLGKLTALAGVAAYPSRVKCATLAWHTIKAALAQSEQRVTTE